MSLIAMVIAAAVFVVFFVVCLTAIVVIIRKVVSRSKDAGVNLKDGVSSEELAIISKILREEAENSKELELLGKLKDITAKALNKNPQS